MSAAIGSGEQLENLVGHHHHHQGSSRDSLSVDTAACAVSIPTEDDESQDSTGFNRGQGQKDASSVLTLRNSDGFSAITTTEASDSAEEQRNDRTLLLDSKPAALEANKERPPAAKLSMEQQQQLENNLVLMAKLNGEEVSTQVGDDDTKCPPVMETQNSLSTTQLPAVDSRKALPYASLQNPESPEIDRKLSPDEVLALSVQQQEGQQLLLNVKKLPVAAGGPDDMSDPFDFSTQKRTIDLKLPPATLRNDSITHQQLIHSLQNVNETEPMNTMTTDSDLTGSDLKAAAVPAPVPQKKSPSGYDQDANRKMSDEELARALQQHFQQEESSLNPSAAVDDEMLARLLQQEEMNSDDALGNEHPKSTDAMVALYLQHQESASNGLNGGNTLSTDELLVQSLAQEERLGASMTGSPSVTIDDPALALLAFQSAQAPTEQEGTTPMEESPRATKKLRVNQSDSSEAGDEVTGNQKKPPAAAQVNGECSNDAGNPTAVSCEDVLSEHIALRLQREEMEEDQLNEKASEQLALQLEQEELQSRKVDEDEAMMATSSGLAWKFVEDLLKLSNDLLVRNLMSDVSLLAVDDIVFLTEQFILCQNFLRNDGAPTLVSCGFHYTQASNLDSIRRDGLMTQQDREARGVGSRRAGAYFGDGIYAGKNALAFRHMGDTGLLVAMMRGREQSVGPHPGPHPHDVDTFIGNKKHRSLRYRDPGYIRTGAENDSQYNDDGFFDEIVLKRSSQCLPLFSFSSNSLPQHATSSIWTVHKELQPLLDRFFNEGVTVPVEESHPTHPNSNNALRVPRSIRRSTISAPGQFPTITHRTTGPTGATMTTAQEATQPHAHLQPLSQRFTRPAIGVFSQPAIRSSGGTMATALPTPSAPAASLPANTFTTQTGNGSPIQVSSIHDVSSNLPLAVGYRVSGPPQRASLVQPNGGYSAGVSIQHQTQSQQRALTIDHQGGSSSPILHQARAHQGIPPVVPGSSQQVSPPQRHGGTQGYTPPSPIQYVPQFPQDSPPQIETLYYEAPYAISNIGIQAAMRFVSPYPGQKCPICNFEMIKDTPVVQLPCFDHVFHHACAFPAMVANQGKCPTCCKQVGWPQGTSPSGKMEIRRFARTCSGFESTTTHTIKILYTLDGGTQKDYHPSPGMWFAGATRLAFLPDNQEARDLLTRIKYAWKRGLIFSIGTSRSTGRSNVVVWGLIPHKTALGGEANHGFPDSTYFIQCNASLDAAGVPKAADIKFLV